LKAGFALAVPVDRLSGKTGDGLLHLTRATVRDHRVVDPSVF